MESQFFLPTFYIYPCTPAVLDQKIKKKENEIKRKAIDLPTWASGLPKRCVIAGCEKINDVFSLFFVPAAHAIQPPGGQIAALAQVQIGANTQPRRDGLRSLLFWD